MTHAKLRLIQKLMVQGMLIILVGMLPSVRAQNAAQGVPLVTTGAMPLYPRPALAAHIQGIVKLRVTTDGEKVASVETESGPPMLVKAAKENVLTWKFDEHKPTTFVTTFEYVIEREAKCGFSNGVSTLKLPLEVRISSKGVQTCDPVEEIKPRP